MFIRLAYARLKNNSTVKNEKHAPNQGVFLKSLIYLLKQSLQ